jgi:hypothetical protein
MRKTVVYLFFCFFAAGGLAAQVSIGAGGYLAGDLGGGNDTRGDNIKLTRSLPYIGGGGFLFFDAKYVEVSFGVFAGSGKNMFESTLPAMPSMKNEATMTYTNFSIGAFAKYPFSIGKTLSVFPLLGIEYLITASVKENGSELPEPGNFNSLWLKLGAGLDIALNSHLYVRLDALYGLRAPTKFEEELLSTGEYIEGTEYSWYRLGHGPTVKLAIGYKF